MNKLLEYEIFHFGDIHLTLSSIILLALFVTGSFLFLQIIRRTVFRTNKIDYAKKHSIYSLIKYFWFVFACVIGLQILGFNLSVLIAGSAALLVGIGLGLQKLFSDFISGIVLLLDSTVKVNDIIDVNGLVGKVQQINLRTTTVLTRDDTYIILPNSDLTEAPINNWTHSAVASRFQVTVGVDYSSDVPLVMRILKEAADRQKEVMKDPAPFVRFTDYGESSLNFAVLFWAEEVFRIDNIKSDIRVRIFEKFAENNVTIPFPQRVVHVKEKNTLQQ